MPQTPAPRTIVYVDGFNLYYGSLRGHVGRRWLDLAALFKRLRSADDIRRIRYFTAPAGGDDSEPQRRYLEALKTTPLVEVHLGKFHRRPVPCEVRRCRFSGPRRFDRREEKRTDVHIGVRMLDDAYQDACDHLVLVTGDSDQVPAIERVQERFPLKQISVYVPVTDDSGSDAKKEERGKFRELGSVTKNAKPLSLKLIAGSQFPATLRRGTETIHRPAGW